MRYLVILFVILLCGCTTLSKNVQLISENKVASEVVIYRSSAFQAGANSMYLGVNDQYFIKLRNDQFARIKIDSGEYLFQSKADASPSFELAMILKPNTKSCLIVEPNPDMVGAVIIPLIANMVPTFVIREVTCPTEAFLKDYEQVYSS